jgi:hypothetical protein
MTFKFVSLWCRCVYSTHFDCFVAAGRWTVSISHSVASTRCTSTANRVQSSGCACSAHFNCLTAWQIFSSMSMLHLCNALKLRFWTYPCYICAMHSNCRQQPQVALIQRTSTALLRKLTFVKEKCVAVASTRCTATTLLLCVAPWRVALIQRTTIL